MIYNTSETYESFVPIYDAVPETWEEGRKFLVEQLKKISEGVNNREIGFLLQEQLLTGKQLFKLPNTPDEFRSVFRKVVDCSPLIVGVNPPIAHGINFNDRFTLIDLWVAGTDSVAFLASVITDINVTMDATNLNITSPRDYDRALAIIEYCLEV